MSLNINNKIIIFFSFPVLYTFPRFPLFLIPTKIPISFPSPIFQFHARVQVHAASTISLTHPLISACHLRATMVFNFSPSQSLTVSPSQKSLNF
ncbi:hypothetical protein IC582_024321 [Cucumis melo]